MQPRADPATGKPFRLGYNQVFVDPVRAEVRGQRDSTAISVRPVTLMPFLRKLHYTLQVPAVWGRPPAQVDHGHGRAGVAARQLRGDLCDDAARRLKVTTNPKATHARPPHRTPAGWWHRSQPSGTIRWRAGGCKLNFDLHRAVGLWIWPLILIIAFTSFSLNSYKEVF